MTETVAKLTIGDQTYEFPVISGSVGPDVIDIRSLYAKTGMFTYDPGYLDGGLRQLHHLHRRRRR